MKDLPAKKFINKLNRKIKAKRVPVPMRNAPKPKSYKKLRMPK